MAEEISIITNCFLLLASSYKIYHSRLRRKGSFRYGAYNPRERVRSAKAHHEDTKEAARANISMEQWGISRESRPPETEQASAGLIPGYKRFWPHAPRSLSDLAS